MDEATLTHAWERIEAFVARTGGEPLPAGATPEARAAAERAVGVTFPEDLRAAYLRHDGGRIPIRCHGDVIAGCELLPLDRIPAVRAFLDEGDDPQAFTTWLTRVADELA